MCLFGLMIGMSLVGEECAREGVRVHVSEVESDSEECEYHDRSVMVDRVAGKRKRARGGGKTVFRVEDVKERVWIEVALISSGMLPVHNQRTPSSLRNPPCLPTGIHLGIKPLQLIVLPKDCPIHPIPILLDHLLGMHTMQLVLPLISATAIGAFLGGTKDPNVDVRVVERGDLELAEEV